MTAATPIPGLRCVPPDGEAAPRVILSYGLGVDSTAILLRWLTDPSSRDFELSELAVITAQTGDEWRQTGDLVERRVYPLLRRSGVRTIQVARAGPREVDGVMVLADTRAPGRVFLDGAYRLSEEMLAAGTVPQLGGARKCSQKAKGVPLDKTIVRITGGAPFRHVMGFECTETSRVEKDQFHGGEARTREYPLLAWGWDRAACEAFIKSLLGVEWPKSACTYCPFALATEAGRARVLAGFVKDPRAAVVPLLMEYTATAFNPRQSLMRSARLLDLVRSDPRLAEAWQAFRAEVAGREWALYDVRRARPQGGVVMRSVRVLATGRFTKLRDRLAETAASFGTPLVDADGHLRFWIERPGESGREHLRVLAPATAQEKQRPGFDAAWAATYAPPDLLGEEAA